MPLRQIITLRIERFLEKIGVNYTFPTVCFPPEVPRPQ